MLAIVLAIGLDRLPFKNHPEGGNGFNNVFKLLLTQTFKIHGNFAPDLVMKLGRDMDSARLGTRLNSGRHIDTVPQQVVPFNDHVPQVQAHPQHHAVDFITTGVASKQALLKPERRLDRVNRTGKLGNHRVASGGENSAVVGPNKLVGDGSTGAQIFKRAVFVFAHLEAKSHHIGRQNGSELSTRCWVSHELPSRVGDMGHISPQGKGSE